MLSENKDNSIIQYLSNSYLESKRKKAQLKLYLVFFTGGEKKQQSLILAKIGDVWSLFQLGQYSYFCRDYRVAFLGGAGKKACSTSQSGLTVVGILRNCV